MTIFIQFIIIFKSYFNSYYFITTLSIMTHNTTTLSIMTHNTTTLSITIKNYIKTLSITTINAVKKCCVSHFILLC